MAAERRTPDASAAAGDPNRPSLGDEAASLDGRWDCILAGGASKHSSLTVRSHAGAELFRPATHWPAIEW